MVSTVARLLHLELDQWVISGMHILGLASFAKIVIRARATLEANACDRGLLASIAGDTMMNNCSAGNLAHLQKRMLCRVHSRCLTLGAQIKIRADCAIVSRADDREYIASIASDVSMNITGGALLFGRLLLGLLAGRFALESKVKRTT